MAHTREYLDCFKRVREDIAERGLQLHSVHEHEGEGITVAYMTLDSTHVHWVPLDFDIPEEAAAYAEWKLSQ